MNRLSRVLLAGLVMASSLIMPVGAWDKYSFVGDSVYFGTPVSDAQLSLQLLIKLWLVILGLIIFLCLQRFLFRLILLLLLMNPFMDFIFLGF